jgi:NADPH-dependent curcumin reductase CurA
MTLFNQRIVLASRPHGAPTLDNFRLEEQPLPEIKDGEVLLKTLYLSLDPYMRGRMSEGPSYAAPVALGEVMDGGAVSEVIASRHDDFSVGDRVLGYTGWQSHAISSGTGLTRLPATLAQPSWALGVLGMPGFTAYMGLLDIGQPKTGETVVVAAATGAVGSLVGQIAKLKGCRVVGIAGGSTKCRYAVEELGFDACVDHHSDNLPAQLALACPDGIDVYFENVGGQVLQAVVPLLNTGARIPLCGLIAQYNSTELPEGPDFSPLLLRTLLTRRVTLKGFIIFDDYGHRYPEFAAQMGAWLQEGKIRYREDHVQGLTSAPQAFIGLLEGKNFGKLVIDL